MQNGIDIRIIRWVKPRQELRLEIEIKLGTKIIRDELCCRNGVNIWDKFKHRAEVIIMGETSVRPRSTLGMNPVPLLRT